MLDKQKIVDHLQKGGTVRVDNLWTFSGLHMECDANQEYPCCEDDYLNFDEAFTAIVDFSDSQEENVRLV